MSPEDRFTEFQLRDAEVSDAIRRNMAPLVKIQALQAGAAFRSRTPAKRLYWMRKAAGTIAQAIAPIAACRPKCDACCHIPVMLLASEAKQIGREIGVVLKEVPEHLRNAPPPRWQGAGHACPFLKDSQCSIYDSRPLPCRVHFNLDRDALLCQHGDVPIIAPYLDTRGFDLQAIKALDRSQDEFVAELREFF